MILTFEVGQHPAREAEPTELVVEDLVSLEGGCSTIGYFYAGCLAVEYPVAPEHWVTLRAHQHSRLRVPEDVILLQDACNQRSHPV